MHGQGHFFCVLWGVLAFESEVVAPLVFVGGVDEGHSFDGEFLNVVVVLFSVCRVGIGEDGWSPLGDCSGIDFGDQFPEKGVVGVLCATSEVSWIVAKGAICGSKGIAIVVFAGFEGKDGQKVLVGYFGQCPAFAVVAGEEETFIA